MGAQTLKGGFHRLSIEKKIKLIIQHHSGDGEQIHETVQLRAV